MEWMLIMKIQRLFSMLEPQLIKIKYKNYLLLLKIILSGFKDWNHTNT